MDTFLVICTIVGVIFIGYLIFSFFAGGIALIWDSLKYILFGVLLIGIGYLAVRGLFSL